MTSKKKENSLTGRARSQDQKDQRRADILAVAHKAVIAEGYESLSMASLAKQTGLAKGTLYLYFKTREELFLALYNEILVRWCEEVMALVEKSGELNDLPDILIDVSKRTDLFLELGTKVTSVLEKNVSTQSLVAGKRQLMGIAFAFSSRLEDAFELKEGEGQRLATASFAILLGAAHMDGSYLLDHHTFDDEVSAFINMSRFEIVVQQSLGLVIEAIGTNKDA